jgi:hypothetical protein
MFQEAFQKIRQFLILIWYFVRRQPVETSAEIEERLARMPEPQTQRILRRWKRSRARSLE